MVPWPVRISCSSLNACSNAPAEIDLSLAIAFALCQNADKHQYCSGTQNQEYPENQIDFNGLEFHCFFSGRLGIQMPS
jgi:hypothetical protein